MKISQNTVVSLNYSMFDDKGRLIDKNEQPVVYLHGGYDNILLPVESALESCISGDTVRIIIGPDEAFGRFEPDLVREEDIELLPENVEVGMTVEKQDPSTGRTRLFRVVMINADKVILDGNHPLAGMFLRFEATILEMRAATEDEIKHGRAHDICGHAQLH